MIKTCVFLFFQPMIKSRDERQHNKKKKGRYTENPKGWYRQKLGSKKRIRRKEKLENLTKLET